MLSIFSYACWPFVYHTVYPNPLTMEGKRLSAEHNCDNIAMFAKSTSSRKMCCFSSLEWCVLHTQSCPTLCYPMDSSPPGSSVHGIFQTRILEWVAISFSRGSSQPRDQTWVSCIAGKLFTVWATRETLRVFISQEERNRKWGQRKGKSVDDQ